MNIQTAVNQSLKLVRDNSHTILTALGVSGTITTAYLGVKAGYETSFQLSNEPAWLTRKEKAKLVWKTYIPTIVSGAVTVACIIGASRAGSKRTAAAYSLLTVSEKAFTEYKEKIVEQIGEKKEKAIRDEIAADRVKQGPGTGVVVVGAGNVLCYEMHTGRYFMSDMETLRRAVNDLNAKMNRETGATLSDFYYMIGLSPTQYSDHTGWDSCKQLELSFSTVMSDDSRPCIAFSYNYIEPF